MKIGSSHEEKKLGTLLDLNSDIIFLLDHHMDEQKKASLLKNNRKLLSQFTFHGTPSLKRGILILAKKNCGCKITHIKNEWENDMALFEITLPDTTIVSTLIIYAPSKDSPKFWEQAYEEINSTSNDLKLIIGDFNCTLDHKLDTLGYKTDPHPKSRTIINNWLENEMFIDTFRHFNPDIKSFTFRTKNCKLRSRLDYCLTSPSLIQYVKRISHIAHNYANTDHSSVLIEIDVTNTPRGKGIFRCPPNAHNDPSYQRLIKNSIKKSIFESLVKSQENKLQCGLFEARIRLEEELDAIQTMIPNWNTQYRQQTLEHTIAILLSNEPTNEELINRHLSISKPQLLEYILHNMKSDTIAFSKKDKHTTNNHLNHLKATLQDLISEPESEENSIAIHETQEEIEIMETKVLYDSLSKKANFNLLENERPTKAFLSMENSKQGYSEVTKLRIPNTRFNPLLPESALNMKYFTITDDDLIRYEMKTAFQNIFKAQPNLNNNIDDIKNFLNSDRDSKPMEELQKRKVTPQKAQNMEGLLTTHELTNSLFKHMKGSSSPGIDGFTVNHLRTFWYELQHITCDALNCSFGGQLTGTLRKAVIKLLRKGTKDQTLTGNYRPISLLSIFYKLASCTITQRIKPAVNQIIGRQQKAYIKTNNIGSIILNLLNMIKHVTEKKKTALILLIDFRKAFDSIDHTFLQNALELFGFGPDIIQWIKLFFSKREAQILMGGHISDIIQLEQGVPQGDVISPYIFILMIEILLIKINHTENLTGITFALIESRSETFADDTTIFLERTDTNLRTATKYITQFHNISGLSCNLDKTVVVPIGQNTNKHDILCPDLGMTWDDTFTILGFTIDNTLKHLDSNFTKIKQKIQNLITLWKPYNLSLRGRITITKVKLVSQLTFVSTVLDTNHSIINEIQELINNFVMGIKPGGKHWISKDIIYTPTKLGGLGVIFLEDFIKAIKCSWVKRYCIDMLDDHWADILDSILNLTPETRHTILKYGPERFNKIINMEIPGLSSILSSYKSLKQQFPTCPSTQDNSWLFQPVFFNTNFTRKYPNSKKTTFLTPTFYGLRDSAHTLTLGEFFPNGVFIEKNSLNTLTGSNLMQMQYENLKAHIKNKVGLNKFYDAIPKLKLPQKKHTHSSIKSLMINTTQGSGTYRKIISKAHKISDVHNPSKWRAKLGDSQISRSQLKQARINLHSKYLGSDTADILTRLKLGKTLFGTQLYRCGISDTPYCNTCLRELNEEISENITHATYECEFVSTVVNEILETFFPHIADTFTIQDILLSTITDKHPLFTGKTGQLLASLIWDFFLKYIITCRNNEKTPIPAICVHEIRSQINRILKILPQSDVSKYILASHTLAGLFH